MNRYFRAVCVAVVLSSFLPIQLPAQVARRLSRLPPSDADRVALADSVPATTAERVGTLSDDTAMTGLSLVLKPTAEQDADLQRLLVDQQDPSKASYHRWLTPQEFGEQFGVAEADLTLLRAWLERAGLRVDEVAPSRNSIRFSGTAADVAAAFGTSLTEYQDHGRNFYGNSQPLQLPGSLAALVRGVGGLSSYRMLPQHVRMNAEQIAAGSASPKGYSLASPHFTTTTTNGTAHYLVPWDFRQIYGINTLINSGFDGTGIKIGVIGQSAVDVQQLTFFQGKTGQPVKMPTMLLVPNTGASNRISGDEAESELDLEYSSGSAPGAAVQFIYTGCTATASSTPLSGTTACNNDGVFTSLSYAITNNLAPILTLSYGGCESSLATYASTTLEPLLKQANAQGQTVLVASGDAGAAACDQTGGAVPVATHGLTVQYPSSSTYVTAVGGTQLNSDSSSDWSATNNSSLGSASGYMAETTWNDTPALKVLLGSTGGVSKLYRMPAWQQPYVVPGAYFRMVPDVSFPASVAFHPYMVCLGDGICTRGTGGFTPGSDGTGVGGTSVAAPNFAAMLAVVEQANGGGALGNLNPAMYALAAGAQASTIFHDITTGDNVMPCKVGTTDCQLIGSMGYSAGLGYDLATGLGSVHAPALGSALKALPARTVTLSLRAIPQRSDITSVQLGNPFSVILDALSNSSLVPTGSVTFKVDGVAQTNTPTLFNGEVTATVSLNTPGQHRIDAIYAGDTNFDGGTASVTVTPTQATPQVSAIIYGGSVALNTPVSIPMTVNAGTVNPTGTVTLVIDGAAASPALSLVSGVVTFNYPGFQTAGRHTVVVTYSGDPLVTAGSSRMTIVTVYSPTQSQSASVTVTAAPVIASLGAPVTLTATVKSATTSSATAPTGFVTFNIDGVSLPTLPLNAVGQASVSQTYTASGTSSVLVSYSGDNLFASAENSLFVTVAGPPAPAISLALSTAAVTIPATSTATLALTVNSVNAFSGPVSFTSSIVSATGASFSGCYVVSPGVVNPSAGSPATATFSMASAGNSLCAKANVVRMTNVAAVAGSPAKERTPWAAVVVAGLFGCGMMRRRMRGLLVVLALSCVIAFTGCGGGSGSSSANPTTTQPPATTSSTAGTYQVRITATAMTTGVSSSGTFSLTVQ